MKKLRRTILHLLLTATLILTCLPVTANASSTLKVHFIDVGQGDAILIQSGSSYSLIDTGKESSYGMLDAYLTKLGVTSLDSLVLTHPDADHIGGADLLMEEYPISTVYMTSCQNDTMEYSEVLREISAEHLNRVNVSTGKTIRLSGVKSKVLSANGAAADTNDSSIVILMKHSKESFLFMGDASAKLENSIARKYNVDVDVLKVSHHGSGGSSAISFVKEASPKYSVISVGANNDYGHPNANALRRLKTYSRQVLRTDQKGTIVVTSTGSKISEKNIATNTYYQGSSTGSTNETTSQTTTSTVVPTTVSFIGNVNTKVYHISSCSSLPAEHNRVYFDTAQDAVTAGYRPCGRCLGN